MNQTYISIFQVGSVFRICSRISWSHGSNIQHLEWSFSSVIFICQRNGKKGGKSEQRNNCSRTHHGSMNNTKKMAKWSYKFIGAFSSIQQTLITSLNNVQIQGIIYIHPVWFIICDQSLMLFLWTIDTSRKNDERRHF